MADDTPTIIPSPTIAALPNGPLRVSGDIPLYRRRPIETEAGEPVGWQTSDRLETRERYALCRCGQSANKPFCDGTHNTCGFESAGGATGTYGERAKVLGGIQVTVYDDRSICTHAGFCGTKVTNVWKLVKGTDDTAVRSQVIAMVDRCPSGALTYRLDDDDESFVPPAIAVIDDGPLWVTGRVPVTNPDGTALEVRAHVTLCRCGSSANKPLCDGSHKAAEFHDA
jgi:CDGSH-type Zn-finger protein